jgi:hypothetical protein
MEGGGKINQLLLNSLCIRFEGVCFALKIYLYGFHWALRTFIASEKLLILFVVILTGLKYSVNKRIKTSLLSK